MIAISIAALAAAVLVAGLLVGRGLFHVSEALERRNERLDAIVRPKTARVAALRGGTSK